MSRVITSIAPRTMTIGLKPITRGARRQLEAKPFRQNSVIRRAGTVGAVEFAPPHWSLSWHNGLTLSSRGCDSS